MTRPTLPTPPSWTHDAIWYQVLLDRFCNGTKTNDPTPVRPWTSAWYDASPWEGTNGETFYKFFVFDRKYGGDIQGLLARLPYLSDLGVNALYLNPVFQAPSLHKYDTTDFRHVDETFGAGVGDYERTVAKEDLLDPSTWTWSESDKIFLDALATMKHAGFRVIIDGVFNHVGTTHPAFKDVKAHGAASPYADWFDVTSWTPFAYRGWCGFKDLPVFRKTPEHGLASRLLREHLVAITQRWMAPDGDVSRGVDGWRLDVPNEVPRTWWAEWRTLVKTINPEAFITGEIWHDAKEWLDGTTFDSVMNYPFAEAAVAWIGDNENQISTSSFAACLTAQHTAYPSPVAASLQNLLDSHDTDRIVSKFANPDRDYESGGREQEDNTYDASKPSEACYRKARLAALLQMTSLGAPMIYYGDEVGMWGSDDPNNRKPMLWADLEPIDNDHLAFYTEAIALRNDHPALRHGDVRIIETRDDPSVLIFERVLETERMLIVLNASDVAAPVTLPGDSSWTLCHGSYVDELLAPISGGVWKANL